MKVVFVIRELGIGGTERRMLDLARALRGRIHVEVVSLTPGGELRDAALREGLLHGRPPPTSGGLLRLRFLTRALTESNPDLIQAFGLEEGYYAALAQRLAGLNAPVLSGYGGGYLLGFVLDRRTRFLLWTGWLDPLAFVCNSRSGAAALRSGCHDRRPVVVIPNGIDGSRARAMNGVDFPEWVMSDNPTVGYIGKFDRFKRADRMVEVALRLANHSARPNFALFGSGPLLDKARARAAEDPCLAGRVFFHGSDLDAARLARHFAVGVLCSDTEGFPNVLLEYMSQGVPCVSTDVGDARVILDEGHAGVLIATKDAEALSQGIAALLDDPLRRRELGAAGFERYGQHYTLDAMAARFARLFEVVLERGHVPEELVA